jgi:hypothetical protein
MPPPSRIRAKEALGLSDNRTATINRWLREKLAELKNEEHLP